jgi:hypothetical protein
MRIIVGQAGPACTLVHDPFSRGMGKIGPDQLRKLALEAIEEAAAASHLGPVPRMGERRDLERASVFHKQSRSTD